MIGTVAESPRLVAVLVVTFGLAISLGCVQVTGSGKTLTEERQVEAFQGVSISGSARAVIRTAPEVSCVVTGDDNIVPILVTEVRDGVLHVETKKSYRTKVPLELKLSAPAIHRLTVSGAGDVEMDGFRGDDLVVNVSGAGDVVLKAVQGAKLSLDVSGAGDVEAHGTVTALVVELSGAGDLDLDGLKTATATVDVSGVGSAELDVSKELVANVSGAGSVRHRGGATVTSQVSGAGNVQSLE